MNPYISIIRPVSPLMAGLSAIVGLILSGAQPSILFLYAFLAVFFITGAGMVINDYYDVEIDKINMPDRPLPSGQISRKTALFYSVGLFSIGILFSALINIYCLALALFNTFLQFLYSGNFKRVFLVGNIMVSYFAASAFIFGALVTFDFKIVGIASLLTFLAIMGREIFKTIEDIKGDKKMGLNTIAVAGGINSSRKIAQGFIATAVLLSPLPYLLDLLDIRYLIIMSVANIIFLYSFSQGATKATATTKLAMFISLLAFLFGKI
ncbi:MAG: UbiA family prenyltransferase [Patescibacteria group bacterium]|nr:UbiA family prenyltransferase [Patescibacteria group bacterium]